MTARLDWVDFKAVQYACRNWHYSRSVPAAKTVKIGVWENGRYIGCVVFSRGANGRIGSPYGLDQLKVCELTRIALSTHQTPVSRIIAIGLRMLRRQSPGIQLVISYAAAEEGHIGTVYQAANWLYEGPKQTYKVRVGDEVIHARTLSKRAEKYGLGIMDYARLKGLEVEYLRGLIRHKYLWPFEPSLREQLRQLAQPFPRVKQAMAGAHPVQRRGGTDPHAPRCNNGDP